MVLRHAEFLLKKAIGGEYLIMNIFCKKNGPQIKWSFKIDNFDDFKFKSII